jgi:hypothetical protein
MHADIPLNLSSHHTSLGTFLFEDYELGGHNAAIFIREEILEITIHKSELNDEGCFYLNVSVCFGLDVAETAPGVACVIE